MKRLEWIFMGKAARSWVSLHSVSGRAKHYKGRYPNKSNHEAWLHRNYISKNEQTHHHQHQKIIKRRPNWNSLIYESDEVEAEKLECFTTLLTKSHDCKNTAFSLVKSMLAPGLPGWLFGWLSPCQNGVKHRKMVVYCPPVITTKAKHLSRPDYVSFNLGHGNLSICHFTCDQKQLHQGQTSAS